MHSFLSEIKKDHNIFIGDYDSYTIISQHSSLEHLIYITKIALLLFDRILMPAAFFWQSQEMAHLLVYLEEAIRCGIVMPVIRDCNNTRDIVEYFDRRVEESQKLGYLSVFKNPSLASEIAGNNNINQVNLLKEINTYTYLNGKSVRQSFSEKWKYDLTDNYWDVNSIKQLLFQSQLSSSERMHIINELTLVECYPQFSRAHCMEQVNKLITPGRIRNLINLRISWLYLSSTAESYKSNFYFSYNPYNRMVFKENLSLLAKTLELFGFTKKVIMGLTIQEILTIRKSPECYCFLLTYRKLVDNVCFNQNDMVERFKKEVNSEMRSEKNRRALFRTISMIQNTSVAVFVGLVVNYFSGSNINYTFGATSGALATVSSIIKHFDRLNQYMCSSSFIDFKEYIIAEKYKRCYQRYIGEIE